MNSHEVLVAARNLIERGWVKGSFTGPGLDSGVCAWGGLCYVAPAGEIQVVRKASEVVFDVIGVKSYGGLAAWNDAPERTKAEVLEAFDKAIAVTAPEPQDPFASAPLDFSPEACALP